MALIRTEVEVEAEVGDMVQAPNTVFLEDLALYICYIEGDLLYLSDRKNAPKNECETSFSEDCYLVSRGN